MQYLRYNTDSQEVVFGIFVDSTDGNTEETGLTIANTDIKIWKAGATTLANKNSGGATHISNGIYYAVFDSTDTNTLGSGKAFVHVSGALYCVIEFCVLPQKVYDSMIAGNDNLEVDTIQIEGTDATNQLNAATPSVTVSDKTGFSLSSSQSFNLTGNITGNLSGSVGSVTGGVTVTTNNDKTGYSLSTAGVTAVQSGLSTLTAQQVWEYTTRTLSAFGFSVTVGTNNDKTGYSLSATPPTAAAIADAVWDEATSGHTGAGSTGAAIVAAGSAGDPWSASLPGAYGAGTAGNIVGNRIDAAVSTRLATSGYTSPPSASDIATAVWGATTRTLSSFGTLVSDISTAVWGATTRTLSAFGFTVAATVADKTGYSLSSASITSVQSGLAKTTDITALNDISVADILAGETESGLTLKHAMQIITALALKATGGGTSSISFRNYGDTKNRLTMTVDEDGNRTAVTISLD